MNARVAQPAAGRVGGGHLTGYTLPVPRGQGLVSVLVPLGQNDGTDPPAVYEAGRQRCYIEETMP
jgi:hypothetical protein